MVINRADSLSYWSEETSLNVGYKSGSVVYYVNKKGVGHAYRAIQDIDKYYTNIPPSDDKTNWAIDYTYASEWKADGKYIEGSRVYYFNGQHTYTYVASVRYFGGNGKPTEEEDDEGYRTWELEVGRNSTTVDYFNFTTLGKKNNLVHPVRKNSSVPPLVALNPENIDTWPIRNYDMVSPDEYIGDRVKEVDANGAIAYDWSLLNSVYESHPYDIYTYVFRKFLKTEQTPDGPIDVYDVFKKGYHWGEYIKKFYHDSSVTNPNGEYWNASVGKRQFFFTDRSRNPNYPFMYHSNEGYSVEMWPNLSENDYEFALWGSDPYTMSGLLQPAGPFAFPIFSSQGFGASGQIIDPDGNIEYPSFNGPPLRIWLSANTEFHIKRRWKFKFFVIKTTYYYVPVWYQSPNPPYGWNFYYERKERKEASTMDIEVVNTVETYEQYNPSNFSNLIYEKDYSDMAGQNVAIGMELISAELMD